MSHSFDPVPGYTQAGGEMEGGDTNTIHGVMDGVGTAYMYMTNMIQTSLATGFLPEFGQFRIPRSNNHSCVSNFCLANVHSTRGTYQQMA